MAETTASRPMPIREDCWSEEATWTLVDAWGQRYLQLNRGNLRQKDWQDVSDAVNLRHGLTKKTRRTDVQCKNRIDTLKKKYKTEKSKTLDSDGAYTSPWAFFTRLDSLIVPNNNNNSQKYVVSPLPIASQPPMGVPLLPYKKVGLGPGHGRSVVLTPVVLPQKRAVEGVDDGFFKRNYSAVAAAAAKVEAEESEESEEEDEEEESEEGKEGGVRSLAKAIERFAETYERVEGMKQRQMVELEKQRMQFAKDLEVQRMQLFMDTQVQLQKVKQAKRSGSSDDIYT